MQPPNDNRVILAVGAGLAILAAVVLALLFMGGGDEAKKATTEEPDTTTGLTVDVADAPELQPSRELRCFVDGQFVGMATLANCAERNGLATDGLDVGLDASGNLAAAPTASFAPPPDLPATDLGEGNPEPVEATGGQNPQPAQASRAQQAGGAPCLRYVGSEWRQLSGGLSLNECVQALYAGTCVRPGEAQYGRHGNLTLRLVPRRVEQSNDNTRFRVLADQDRGCQFPSLR